MKYNKRDNNVYQIRLENEDDLYHLNLLLSEGDQVRALTERRESSQSDRLKSERGKKQKMMLTIDVKNEKLLGIRRIDRGAAPLSKSDEIFVFTSIVIE